MKFRAQVEPPEPMRGLEVPQEVVDALGGGKRPRVTITINGHSWRSRVAIMRGRNLLGLSIANRQAAGIVTGDEVEVDVEFDAEPRVVVEPADFARALNADPVARTAYDRLAYGRKLQHVRAIEGAKKPETRIRRIEQAVAMLGAGNGTDVGRRSKRERDEVKVIVAEAELAIAGDRSGRRSGDPVGWDDLLSAVHELQRLEMPPTEIHTVLVTDDPDVVRRLLELHRERLQERLADDVARVGRIEASLSEAFHARTRARSSKTLVAGDESREPDPVGALAAEG